MAKALNEVITELHNEIFQQLDARSARFDEQPPSLSTQPTGSAQDIGLNKTAELVTGFLRVHYALQGETYWRLGNFGVRRPRLRGSPPGHSGLEGNALC